MGTLLFALQAVVSLSVVLMVSLWLWYEWSHRRQLAVARALPTVLPTLPIIGHLHYFIRGYERFTENILKFITISFSNTTCVWFGPTPFIILNQEKDIQKFLSSSKTLEKSSFYDIFNVVFGNGLFTAPVHFWKKTRRHFTPMFQQRNIDLHIPVFNNSSQLLVESLSVHVNQGHVDVMPLISHHSVRNLIITLLGSDQPDVQFVKEFIETLEKSKAALVDRGRYIWLLWDNFFRFVYRNLLYKIETLWEVIQTNITQKKLEERKNNSQLNKYPDNIIKSNGLLRQEMVRDGDAVPFTTTDVFQKLQEIDPQFDNVYMQQEVITLATAGTETVTVAMSSCLMALATYPDIQNKVYNELIDVLGDRCKHITVSDVNKMVYMDQVLKETMRRFVVGPLITRSTKEDVQISDCKIPVGSNVIISIIGLMKNPGIFPDPERFDPDRFTPENVAKRGRYSYIPFSAGPRDCIGKYYAMLLMKVTIAHIIKAYIVNTDEDINKLKFKYSLSLVSLDGYRIRFKKRDT